MSKTFQPKHQAASAHVIASANNLALILSNSLCISETLRLEAIALRLEAIASGLEAIASGLEAIALRLEAIALRLEAIATRLEDPPSSVYSGLPPCDFDAGAALPMLQARCQQPSLFL